MKLSIKGALAVTFLVATPLMSRGAQTSNDESLVFGYCGDYARSIGTTSPDIKELAAAIEIPADLATQWSGAKLVGVKIGYGTSSVNRVNVFVGGELDSAPIYSQNGVVSIQDGWNTIMLNTPYEISGTPFFVGYTTAVSNVGDAPIGIDDIKDPTSLGDYVNLYGNWQQIGKFYGNVCIRLLLQGDNLPQYDVAINSLGVPPIVEKGNPFTATLTLTNNGLKTINDVTVLCTINGEEAKSTSVSVPEAIPSGETGKVEISGLVSETFGSNSAVEVSLLKINGIDYNNPEGNTISAYFNCAEKTFKRNVVVEEFTGTWCGNCPAGIVALSYMRNHYGNDGFIGIAAHYGDVMAVNSYSSVVERFGSNAAGVALPACSINRTIQTYPATENIEYYYLEQSQYPAGAEVEVEAVYTPEDVRLEATATAQFSFDYENAPYALAFVVMEDNVGPYTQKNYFSGGNYGGLEGWNEKPAEVEMYFDEVARVIKNPMASMVVCLLRFQPSHHIPTLLHSPPVM